MEKDTKRVWHLPYCFWNQGNWSANLRVWRRRVGCWKSVPMVNLHLPPRHTERIYESRDGQRADYVKTLADIGVEKVGDMGSFLITAQESGRCAVYALF